MKETTMTKDLREKLKANIFPAAHAAVELVDGFPWHTDSNNICDSWKKHSSQALAIDVFGTIKQSPLRDMLMDAIASKLGLPSGGPWEVNLEWLDPFNHMKEKRRTQVDVMARNSHSLIFFECKFTEQDGGSCSQPKPLPDGKHKGKHQCNGNYEEQANPVNGKIAKCALTAKGIRYWDIIPKVLNYQPTADYRPCPFRGPWFQWMRNLTACSEVARNYGVKPAFVLVYADGDELPMAEKIKSPAWAEFISSLNKERIIFYHTSFQALVWTLQTAVVFHERPQALWIELDKWVEEKIQAVCRGKSD